VTDTANFTDILNKKAADTEEPKNVPTGTYLAAIQSLPEQRPVDTKDGPRLTLRFKCKLLMPKEDVSMDQLTEYGDLSKEFAQNHDIWIDTPAGEFALQQFLRETLGLDLGEGRTKKSYSELLPECVGKQLLVTIVHKMGMRDGKPTIFVNIGSVAHV
jgi:hypothetical protein